LSPLEDISQGLQLPNRGILIPWGGKYDLLRAEATEAKDWLPYGHTERYGQLHWEDEILLPDPRSDRFKGKVVAYVKGTPLTVRRFECYIWDDFLLKRDSFRYAVWMHALTRTLGPPEIDSASLQSDLLYAPTLIWRRGKVTIESFYQDFKGSEYSGVRISHKDEEL
jgi:hypothetical protein